MGGHNLKMYKKYIKRKSPRCLRSLCACCLRVEGVFSPLPPLSLLRVCVSRCVCVWRVLITSQKVKLGQNASAAEHEPTSQCVCVCVCVCASLCLCLCVWCVCLCVCVWKQLSWLLLRPFAIVVQWARTRALSVSFSSQSN